MPITDTFGISDIGCVRQNNEDVWATVLEKQFFALADGMGGRKAGEVAAQLTIENLCQIIEASPLQNIPDLLEEAIGKTNSLVYTLSKEKEEWQGMGTTLCCCLFLKDTFYYAHVGDSRIYCYRNKHLERLTIDHSLRAELIARGELSESASISFPYKNIVTRAIGTSVSVEPTIGSRQILSGDIYFLCTDGLTDYLTDAEIIEEFTPSRSLQEIGTALVERAKAQGSSDNISIVLIAIL